MVPVVGQSKTKLVVGRGRLFFDPFKDGTREKTGEVYLGNTPAFSVTRSVESTQRVRSVGGRKVVSPPIILAETYSASFTTDNISYFNLANWFGSKYVERDLPGSTKSLVIVAQYGHTYNINDGSQESSAIVAMEARIYDRLISVEDNFDTSQFKYGRFYTREIARDIVDGDVVTLTIITQEMRVADLSPSDEPIIGSLRYLSFNVAGDDVAYEYPMVVLSPTGSLDLKSDDFQQISFNVDILKISHKEQFQYLRILPKLSKDEKTLLDALVTLAEFPLWEDRFNRVVQQGLPKDRIEDNHYIRIFPRRSDIP
jgi:hypothetical protein